MRAPRELVFDALTNSDAIVRFFPLSEVVSDWRVGGEVLYRGEVDGNYFTDFGIIEKLTRPHEYQYRYWSDNHGTERLDENYSTIHYRLLREKDGTVLKPEQRNLPSKALFDIMNELVWDSLLESLRAYVESDTVIGATTDVSQTV